MRRSQRSEHARTGLQAHLLHLQMHLLHRSTLLRTRWCAGVESRSSGFSDRRRRAVLRKGAGGGKSDECKPENDRTIHAAIIHCKEPQLPVTLLDER